MTAHLLLDELRRRGVKLSTDGTTLQIDAPKGVITPDLREQIATQKQDLIALVAHGFPALGDEDEDLYNFALTVSLIVDVLGGPDKVQISRIDPNVTSEELTRPLRPPYQPVILPALPRSICPFEVAVVKHMKDGDHLKRGQCQGKPLAHGWCADHARSHELLCLGALLGYPRVEWSYGSIGEGVIQWEGYAKCVSRSLEREIASIRARFGVPDTNAPASV